MISTVVKSMDIGIMLIYSCCLEDIPVIGVLSQIVRIELFIVNIIRNCNQFISLNILKSSLISYPYYDYSWATHMPNASI